MRQDQDAEQTIAPLSPCTKVCSLDGDGFCIGCLRTGDEIGRWTAMSPSEQWNLVAELEERRKLRAVCAV
jgi:predicted Fe-S protein YdhL (DUF1289 family)